MASLPDEVFSVLSLSQSSDLSKDELDKIEDKAKAPSTKRTTAWGVKKFEAWCKKRQINVSLADVSPPELNDILRKFYAEVKSEKGKPLTASALNGIRAARYPRVRCALSNSAKVHFQSRRFLV